MCFQHTGEGVVLRDVQTVYRHCFAVDLGDQAAALAATTDGLVIECGVEVLPEPRVLQDQRLRDLAKLCWNGGRPLPVRDVADAFETVFGDTFELSPSPLPVPGTAAAAAAAAARGGGGGDLSLIHI